MVSGSDRTPILWLGAHKTGTTFLQKALDLSQEALVQEGIHYQTLTQFRKNYTRPLIYEGKHGKPAEPDTSLNLIFDENIPNLVQHALSPEGLYPGLEERSRKVWDYFGLGTPDIYFGVRDYSGYLPSLFCEALKSTPYRPFNEFYKSKVHPLDWNTVIDRIRSAFPESNIYVYRYEDLRGAEAQLLSKVTGVDAAKFNIPRKATRQGFSHRAVRSLYELSKERPVTTKDVFEAIRTYPRNKKRQPFSPFKPERIDFLRKKYDGALNRIDKRSDATLLDLSSAVEPIDT